MESTNGSLYSNWGEHVPMGADLSRVGCQVVSPGSGHIIGEGATVSIDMREAVLDALDQQMVLLAGAQGPEGSLTGSMGQAGSRMMSDAELSCPDLCLPVVENNRMGDKFYGYLDSLSADGNPMVLVELRGLSCRYGASMYAVDGVNGTMCSKFGVGCRMISEKAAVRCQFRPTSLEDECTAMRSTYVNTPPGVTSVDAPVAGSALVTLASQMPSMPIVLPCMRDMLEPSSGKQVGAAYLERWVQSVSSVGVPSGVPSLEGSALIEPGGLSGRVHDCCQGEGMAGGIGGRLMG